MKTLIISAALLLTPALLFADTAIEAAPAVPPAAGNAARPVLREWIKKKFDSDQDGKLSETERGAAKAALKEKGSEVRAKVLEKFDTDHNGSLSRSERESAKAALTARGGAKNKDSAAKKAGARAALLRRVLLEKFDADKDGQLSETERAKAREARKNRSVR